MLTADQLDHFRQRGYLVLEGAIGPERLQHYTQLCTALVEKSRQLQSHQGHYSLELDADEQPIPGMLHKVQGVCLVEPLLLDLAREPAIIAALQPLLGGDIDVFGTKFFPKLPGGGTSTYWHQDNFYFGTTSDQVISCGIYLQDADRQNGCLRLIPGSHHSGQIAAHQRKGQTHGSWTQVDEDLALELPTAAGTAVLFSANLLHGATDNHSQRSRYSTAWHYVPADLNLERFPRGDYEDRHLLN